MSIYQQKYLKYKTKYLRLKQSMYGGSIETIGANTAICRPIEEIIKTMTTIRGDMTCCKNDFGDVSRQFIKIIQLCNTKKINTEKIINLTAGNDTIHPRKFELKKYIIFLQYILPIYDSIHLYINKYTFPTQQEYEKNPIKCLNDSCTPFIIVICKMFLDFLEKIWKYLTKNHLPYVNIVMRQPLSQIETNVNTQYKCDISLINDCLKFIIVQQMIRFKLPINVLLEGLNKIFDTLLVNAKIDIEPISDYNDVTKKFTWLTTYVKDKKISIDLSDFEILNKTAITCMSLVSSINKLLSLHNETERNIENHNKKLTGYKNIVAKMKQFGPPTDDIHKILDNIQGEKQCNLLDKQHCVPPCGYPKDTCIYLSIDEIIKTRDILQKQVDNGVTDKELISQLQSYNDYINKHPTDQKPIVLSPTPPKFPPPPANASMVGGNPIYTQNKRALISPSLHHKLDRGME